MDNKQCFVDYALREITCTFLIMLLFHCRYIYNNNIRQLADNGCKNNAPNESFKISLSFVPSRFTNIYLTLLISDLHNCFK